MDYIQKYKANNVLISIFGIAVICFSFFYFQYKKSINTDNELVIGSLAAVAIFFCVIGLFGSLISRSILKLGNLKTMAMSATSIWILLCLFIRLY
tara:strand:+ start:4572 stop:4856 length:285 start_codon:yes stop_codon:yes gene_type:complete